MTNYEFELEKLKIENRDIRIFWITLLSFILIAGLLLGVFGSKCSAPSSSGQKQSQSTCQQVPTPDQHQENNNKSHQ